MNNKFIKKYKIKIISFLFLLLLSSIVLLGKLPDGVSKGLLVFLLSPPYKIFKITGLSYSDNGIVFLISFIFLYWYLISSFVSLLHDKINKRNRILILLFFLLFLVLLSIIGYYLEWDNQNKKIELMEKCRNNPVAPGCESYCNNRCGANNLDGFIPPEETYCICTPIGSF
jgi:hypothetical protein